MKIDELNDKIASICPIDGINSDGVIWFNPEATDGQKSQAQALMDSELATLGTPSPNDQLQQQIDSIKATMTQTVIMAAIGGDATAISKVNSANQQIAALKALMT